MALLRLSAFIMLERAASSNAQVRAWTNIRWTRGTVAIFALRAAHSHKLFWFQHLLHIISAFFFEHAQLLLKKKGGLGGASTFHSVSHLVCFLRAAGMVVRLQHRAHCAVSHKTRRCYSSSLVLYLPRGSVCP